MNLNNRTKKSLIIIGLLIVIIAITGGQNDKTTPQQTQSRKNNSSQSSPATPQSSPANKTVPIQPGYYDVAYFTDGDTISVNMDGKIEKVRFIGVDTPETHKPNTPVQCYGPAAAAFTKNVIGNQKVRLEADPLSSNRDKYGRLLRYIYLPDGTNLNAELVATGNAFYYPYFPFEKSQEFANLQSQAQAGNKGLWGNCSPTKNSRGGYTSNSL